MLTDAIQKLASVRASKGRFLAENPLGFWLSAMMAGIYVGFGILLIFGLGSLVDPSVRPLVMGATFGLALILVVFAGSEPAGASWLAAAPPRGERIAASPASAE
jgi:nitrite transporter NirC